MADREEWFDQAGALDKQATEGDCQELEFTEGIEAEYFLVDKDGIKLPHADFGAIYGSIISREVQRGLEEALPKQYDEKIMSLRIATSKSSTFDALHISYRVRGKKVKAELISVDRNVAEWPLVEIATPPCESFYELAWWQSMVIKLVNERLENMGYDHYIMPFGVNPFERVEDITQLDSFPTCGEHYHIKVVEDSSMDPEERLFFSHFYHMIRFFNPYLIPLSACSPFAGGGLWGRYREGDTELPFPGCVRSIRVMFNKKHLCNYQESEYLPYLEKGWLDLKYFIDEFKKQSSSFRSDTHFFDIDPYSANVHTTEVRFFDTQPSIARRVGVAMLVQMLAKKAKKMVNRDEESLLDILSETNPNLHALKKMACEGGNWFKPQANPLFGELSGLIKLKQSSIEKNLFSDLVLGMMYILRDEIRESNIIYSKFLGPIRQSIYGLEGNGISPAQYWLLTYIQEGQDMARVVNRIRESNKKSENLWYDPIVNEPIILNEVLKA